MATKVHCAKMYLNIIFFVVVFCTISVQIGLDCRYDSDCNPGNMCLADNLGKCFCNPRNSITSGNSLRCEEVFDPHRNSDLYSDQQKSDLRKTDLVSDKPSERQRERMNVIPNDRFHVRHRVIHDFGPRKDENETRDMLYSADKSTKDTFVIVIIVLAVLLGLGCLVGCAIVIWLGVSAYRNN